MRLRALGALAIMLLSPGGVLAAEAADTPDAKQLLLESAAYWRENGRADLARQALEKYLQTNPEDARAWYRLGMLGIRMGEPQRCTDVVRRMREVLPEAPYTEALAARCRVATRDRLEMAAVRRLAEARQYADAAEAFEALFDGNIPGGELGVEYLWLRSQAGASWSELHPAYQRIASQFPEHLAVQMAYAGHLAQQPATAREAIRRIRSLRDEADNEAQALRYWRAALRSLSGAPNALEKVRAYLVVDPDNAEFQRMAARLARSDLRTRAGTLSEKGEHAAARRMLGDAVARYPKDPWLRHDLARAHIALGEFGQARAVVAAGVRRQPKDPVMRYVAALVLRALARPLEAVDQLEAVPQQRRSASMEQLLSALRFNQCLQSGGDPTLLECMAFAGSDAERWQQLVAAWSEHDLLDTGVERMADWRRRHDASAELDRIWAQLLSRAGRHVQAQEVLVDLRSRSPAAARDPALMEALVEVTIRAFEQGARREAPVQLIASIEGASFDAAKRYRWMAQLHAALGAFDRARAHYAAMAACCAAAMTTEDRVAFARLLAREQDTRAAETQLRHAFVAASDTSAQVRVAKVAADIAAPQFARGLLESAMQAMPGDPWLRHDLARVLIDSGEEGAARAVMEAGVRVDPQQPEMRFATGLILESLGAVEDALEQIEAVPEGQRSAGMQALAQRMRFEQCLAEPPRAAGLAGCVQHAGDDASHWRRLTIARVRAGEEGPAIRAFETWLSPRRDDIDTVIAAIRVFAAAKRQGRVQSLLRDWRGRKGLSEAEQLALYRAEAEWRLAQDPREADMQPLLERVAALADAARDPQPALRLLGMIHEALEQYQRAATHYARVLDSPPVPVQDRLNYARALYGAGAPDRAEEALAHAWAEATGLEARIAVAKAWQPQSAGGAPNPYLAVLRSQQPDDHRVTLAAAEQALEADAPAEAVSLFEAAAAQAPSTVKDRIVERAEAVRARRRGLLAAGYDLAVVPGVSGFSGRRLETQMVEWRMPVAWDDQWIVKADATRMDVGRLNAGDADDYGQFAVIAPNRRDTFFPQPRGQEKGVGLGLAYQGQHWRIDIGSTPIGFPRPFVVGGIRYQGRLHGHQWGVDVSRRPVTSTFLSYAGDNDPVSGEFWGRPRADGVRLDIARYEARFDYSASLYLHQMHGDKIPDNGGLIARASTNRQIVEWRGSRVFLGLAASHWAYERNQRFYTFGHGGYYSPQSFTTLSLPVYVQGGTERWSYAVQLGYAYTHSREDDADFFPGRPDLQADARALGEVPVYEGGSGAGTSIQADLSTEYALSDRLAVGARFAINRADFYEPNFLTLYLRHSLGTGTPHLRHPPQRITPYRDW